MPVSTNIGTIALPDSTIIGNLGESWDDSTDEDSDEEEYQEVGLPI